VHQNPVIEYKTGDKPALTVVLMHGRTLTPDYMRALADRIGLLGIRYLLPSADGNTWYPKPFQAPIAENEPSLTAAIARYESIVANLIADGVDPLRLVVGGFSQGACLTAEYLARHPRRLGGAIVWTGGPCELFSQNGFKRGWHTIDVDIQLSLFANIVAKEAHAGAGELADRFFGCWRETDAEKRRLQLAEIAVPELAFRDPYSCTNGIDDLNAHIAAAQQHMPGVVLERQGDARSCQGLALVEWSVKGPDGNPRAKGTNVFELAKDGRIARVTGVWV